MLSITKTDMNDAKFRPSAGKKALIVSPYLDHLGGGERYMLSAASALESMGYEIYFSWDNQDEIRTLSTMLGITINNPQLDPKIKKLYFSSNPADMYLSTRGYDVTFYLSDGSLPLLGSKKNIVHMQVPFHGIKGKSIKNTIKKMLIHNIVVNSKFTKAVIDKEYGISSTVLYPPVSPIIGNSPKEKIILSVGRFEPSLNTKHQDILIKAFRLFSQKMPDWKMILAGGSSSEDWLGKLKELAMDFPIEFATNVSHDDLSKLYQKSTFYWHAAGYKVDEVKNPELTEHFGISTVEAISAGCIPLVIPYGGQREIVEDQSFHWENIEELVEKTLNIINSPHIPEVDVTKYSQDKFNEQLESIV